MLKNVSICHIPLHSIRTLSGLYTELHSLKNSSVKSSSFSTITKLELVFSKSSLSSSSIPSSVKIKRVDSPWEKFSSWRVSLKKEVFPPSKNPLTK